MPKVALIQMLVVPGQREQNISRAVSRIIEASRIGAEVAIPPEAFDCGWTDFSSRALAEPIPSGSTFQELSRAALSNKIYVVAGITERAGTKIFNSAVLFSPKGDLLLHHRKINELELGHDLYSLGDRLQVCDTPFGRVGLMICADAFARDQVITGSLCYMGAGMIFSPCAWAVPAEHDNNRDPYGQLWLDNYCPVAAAFKTWIIGVSNVGPITSGPWAGRKCIGCSMAINPEGTAVISGSYGERAEEILQVDAQPIRRPARGTGWENLPRSG